MMINQILPNQIYIKRGQSFKGSALLSKKVVDTSYKSIKTDSADYIKYCYSILKSWCRNVLEVNVESERLLNIVKSDEPHIFIMNHTFKPMKDINAAKFFNALLYREYIYNGKAETCPRSKVLANKNILDAQTDKGKLMEWLGVKSINAHVLKSDKEKNKAVITDLIKELGSGKINLFLFPEGALCAIPFLPLEYKFQPGVSSIIKKVLEIRDNIKVVPLGFAHDKKVSSAHIGESIDFYKNGCGYEARQGDNIIKLTENGVPVEYNNVVPYISGVLVNKLKEASKYAKQDLKNSNEKVYTL